MLQQIIAIIMAIISWFAGLFSFGSVNYNAYENQQYGAQSRNVLDMYIPKDASGDMGVLLLIHGGAWIEGDKSAYTKSAKSYCSELGIVTVTMNYQYLSDEQGQTVTIKTIISDITAALNKSKEIAATQNINLTKLMTMGYSAGAHLALLYAYSQKNTAPVKPVCVASLAGVTDLSDPNMLQTDAVKNVYDLLGKTIGMTVTADTYQTAVPYLKEISCISYVDNAVPTIICHGEKDTTVPYSNAVALKQALDAKGVACEYFNLPNSTHALENDASVLSDAYSAIAHYITAYLK